MLVTFHITFVYDPYIFLLVSLKNKIRYCYYVYIYLFVITPPNFSYCSIEARDQH